MIDDKTSFDYTIDVSGNDYTRLMQLVMKYGSGTGEGGSTPTSLRIALADATPRVSGSVTVTLNQDPDAFDPVSVANRIANTMRGKSQT